MTRRTDRIEDQLRQEVSDLLLREVADPRARRAVVVAVEVTPNLSRARFRISAMGTEEEREETIAALRHAAGFLRRQLGRRLRLRALPELDFVLDRGAEHSLRISELLESLHDHHDDEQGT